MRRETVAETIEHVFLTGGIEEAMKNTVELLESGKADEWDFTVRVR